ncbi:MAG: hypothetical protein ACI4S2_08350 [Lachnospiraceae bacterium]
MKILINFTLFGEKKRKKRDSVLQELSEKLKKYREKDQWIGEYIYKIEQNSELYRDVVLYCKKNKKVIEFVNLGYNFEVSVKEKEEAVGFILNFPKYYCEEYEDDLYEYDECEFCWTKEIGKNNFHVQPKGYIKKHHEDYGIAGIDGTGEILLLPKLVKSLLEGGVEKKYFQPVITKRKVIMGYIFVTRNILPEGVYTDPNYKFAGKCTSCGNINLKSEEEEYYFRPKKIKKEAMSLLEDVNYTYEFFNEYREIILSKKVAKIIETNVKYAELVPVFLDE